MKRFRKAIAGFLVAIMTVMPALQAMPSMVLADTVGKTYRFKATATNGNAHFDTSSGSKAALAISTGSKITDESFEITVIPQVDNPRFGFVNKYVDSNNWSYIAMDSANWIFQCNSDKYGNLAFGAIPKKGDEVTIKGEWVSEGLKVTVNNHTQNTGDITQTITDTNVTGKKSSEGVFGFRAANYGAATEVIIKEVKIGGQVYTDGYKLEIPGELEEVVPDTEDAIWHLVSSADNGNGHFGTGGKEAALVKSDASAITNDSFEFTVVPNQAGTDCRFGFVNKYVSSSSWSFIGFDASGWFLQSGSNNWYTIGKTDLGPLPEKNEKVTVKGEWITDGIKLTVNNQTTGKTYTKDITTATAGTDATKKGTITNMLAIKDQAGAFGFRAATFGTVLTDVYVTGIKIGDALYEGGYATDALGASSTWQKAESLPTPTPVPTATPTPTATPSTTPEPENGTKWIGLTGGTKNGGGHAYGNVNANAPAVVVDKSKKMKMGDTLSFSFKSFAEEGSHNFGIFYTYKDDNNWLYIGFDKSSGWYYQYNVNGSGSYPSLGGDLPSPVTGKAMDIQISLDRETLVVTVDGVTVKKPNQDLINLATAVGDNSSFGFKTVGKKISFAKFKAGQTDCMSDNWDLLVNRNGGEKISVDWTKKVPVSGTVKDDQGKPIAGATVRVGLDFTQTDKDGKYTLPAIETGEYSAAATKLGYTPSMKPLKTELADITGFDFVLSVKEPINLADYNYIQNGDMKVYVDKAFPRVAQYQVTEDGKTLVFTGQEEVLKNFSINGEEIEAVGTVKDFKDGNSSITYTMAVKSKTSKIDVNMEVKISVDGRNLTWEVTKIDKQAGCPKISKIDVPNLNILTVISGQEGAVLDAAGISTLTTKRADYRITFDNGFIPGNNKTYPYAFLSKNELSSGLWSNSEAEGDQRVYVVSGPDTMSLKSSPWYYETGDVAATAQAGKYTYPTSDLPQLKVCLASDSNDDKKVDWQDGAIAYRSIMNNPYESEAIKDLVNYRIVMNFESEASNPFLVTADNVRKVALATDGLGQALLLKGYGNEGHDSANSEYADIGERIGGLEDFQKLLEIAHKYNTEVGIHVNAQEAYPESKSFNESMIEGLTSGGWGWLDQSLVINKLWDLGTQARYKRFVQLYDRINGTSHYDKAWPEAVGESTGNLDITDRGELQSEAESFENNMDFIYLDVWYQNAWETRQIAKEINSLGWRFSTEFSDQGEYDSTWQHWSTDAKYGGAAAKGYNSDIIRFIRNDQRDSQVLNWPEYGGTADNPLLGGFHLAGFEGWGGDQNFNNYINTTFNENLPTRFLQHYKVTNLVTYEDINQVSPVGNHEYQYTLKNEEGDTVVITRNEEQRSDTNIERTITLNGKVVLDDVKYLLPWTDSDTNEEKLYNWDLDGGTSTWELPDGWNVSNVVVYELTDQGRVNPVTVPVSGGKVTLDTAAATPYIVVKGEAVKELKDDFGDQNYVADPGFNGYTEGDKLDSKIWSGDVDSDSVYVSNKFYGNQWLVMNPTDKEVAVTTEISGLEKGKDYAVEVYIDNRADAKASIEVNSGSETVSNYTMKSIAKNGVSSDQHHGSNLQYMLVSFTAEGTTADLTLRRSAGEGDTYWDDIRVVQKTLTNWQEDGSFEQDFESVVQGLYPFVLGTVQSGDSVTHLSELHDPYTQSGWSVKILDDVISGNWSLKHHGNTSGLIYRTIPQNFRFEANKVYKVSFDYQSGPSGAYGIAVGDGVKANGTPNYTEPAEYFASTAATAAGQKSTTGHYEFTVQGAASGQTFIGLYGNGSAGNGSWGQVDFILDNLKIVEDTDAVVVQAEDNQTELTVGETSQMTGTNSEGGTWTSSNPEVMTVDENGLAKAIAEGQTVITLKSAKGREGSVTMTVIGSYTEVFTPVDVTANTEESESESGEAANVMDGDSSTFWHSQYSPTIFSVSAENPAILTVDLGEVKNISGFRFQQRPALNNGFVYKYQYAVGNEFDSESGTITDGTLSETLDTTTTAGGQWQDVSLISDSETKSAADVSARYIQIRVVDGKGGFASIAEVEAYSTTKASEMPADFSKLDEQIARANAIADKTLYTKATIEKLEAVWNKLPSEEDRATFKMDPDQEKVDAVRRELKAALDGLVHNEKLDAIRALVNSANEILSGDAADSIQPAKLKVLKDAVTAAEALIQGYSEDTEAIADAMANLSGALADLPEVVSKDTLNALIAAAEALNKDLYVPSDWEKVEKALADAKEVAQNGDATEEEVKAAFDTLTDAIKNLTKIVDKTALKAALEKAKAIDQSKYTSDSIKNLNKVIKEAEELLKKDNATQDDVDKMKASLEKAISDLVAVKNTPKPTKPAGGSGTSSSGNAKTGDSTNVLAVILLMLLGGGGAVLIYSRKRKIQK